MSTRHRASTSMYSLTFCVLVMLPERHQWKPAVQAAAVMLRTPPSTAGHRPASHTILRTPPSPAGHRPAARADTLYSVLEVFFIYDTLYLTFFYITLPYPAERSHYGVISRDGRKLVVMLALCCHSNATRGPVQRLQIRPIVHNYGTSPTTSPSYIRVRAVVWACGRGQTETHTDTHTDARDHNIFCVVYDSRKM